MEAVISPAISILSESTPKNLHEMMTLKLIEDGFFTRFLFISYVKANTTYNREFNSALLYQSTRDGIATIATHALDFDNQMKLVPTMAQPLRQNIPFEDSAEKLWEEYNQDTHVMSVTPNEHGTQQLWVRAGVQTRKMSALNGLGHNVHKPMVEKWNVEWAIKVQDQSVKSVQYRFAIGDAGDATEEMAYAQLVSWIRKQQLKHTSIEPLKLTLIRIMSTLLCIGPISKLQPSETAGLKRIIQTATETGILLHDRNAPGPKVYTVNHLALK